MAMIVTMLGGLVLVRLIVVALHKWVFRERTVKQYAVLPNLVALTLCTVIGGFGFADGGSPQFLIAFATYAPPVVVSCLWDLRRRAKKIGDAPVNSPQ